DKDSEPVEVMQMLHDPAAGPTDKGRPAYLTAIVAGRAIHGRKATIERAGEGPPAGTGEDTYGHIAVMERSDQAVMSADAVVIVVDGQDHSMVSLRAWTLTAGQSILIE